MGKRESMDGFNLRLESFCKYCGDFEPIVRKTDITGYCDNTKKYLIDISCENNDKCLRMMEKLKNK